MKIFPALLLLCCAGCASNYPYYFIPSPAEVRIQPEGSALIARTLITVLEGQKGEKGQPPRMLIRLRVENLSDAAIRLDASSLHLVTSDLSEFGAALVNPPDTEVPPNEKRTYDLRFPFPANLSLSAPSLTGLHLNWRIDYADGTADVSTTFQRSLDPAGYYPDSNVRWSVGVGIYG
ncbi:MAG: hypothetical protein ACI8QZ_002534 [Chlamydiales bacterium]|jgi:hypothetical protein